MVRSEGWESERLLWKEIIDLQVGRTGGVFDHKDLGIIISVRQKFTSFT